MCCSSFLPKPFVELIRVLYILILNFHHGAMSSRCNCWPCSLLIDLSSMLDGYTILRAWITCLIWASRTRIFFIGFKSCMSQQLTTMEGKRGASLQGWIIWSEEQNQMELLIRSWRPHSKHWMEGHLSIASQKPRSWHFNDHLIGLENVDFVLVNLAFKHTSSHNRSRLASLPASLTLWFESTFGFVGFAVLRTQTSEPSKSRERSFYLSCLGASLSFS